MFFLTTIIARVMSSDIFMHAIFFPRAKMFTGVYFSQPCFFTVPFPLWFCGYTPRGIAFSATYLDHEYTLFSLLIEKEFRPKNEQLFNTTIVSKKLCNFRSFPTSTLAQFVIF